MPVPHFRRGASEAHALKLNAQLHIFVGAEIC